jgi:hypothetical protein
MILHYAPRRTGTAFLMTVQCLDRYTTLGHCAMKCSGHATAAGALQHYARFLTGVRAQYRLPWPEEQPCLMCHAPTRTVALLSGMTYPLCPSHQDPESLLSLLSGKLAEAWQEDPSVITEATLDAWGRIREAIAADAAPTDF